jgi:signal transduction histidine kinase
MRAFPDVWAGLLKPFKIFWPFIVCLVFIWGFITYDLKRAHTEALKNANRELENLTRIYAEEVTSSISTIDYVLIDLRGAWKRNRGNFGAEVEERRAYLDPSVAYNVGIIDSEGKLVFASAVTAHPDKSNVNLNDREHFRVHFFTQADRLHISEPVLLRAAHRWAIQFSRPLLDAEDKFDGVIVVSVSPEYFHRFHEKIDLEKDGSIALGKIHGSLIARYPSPELALGKNVMDAPWIFASPSESGFFQKRSEVDQIERLYAWRVVERGDMAVTMGKSIETILAPYHERRLSYLWWGTIATILLSFAAYVLRGHQRQRAQAKEAMQQMKEELAHAQKLESLGKLTGGVTHDFNHVLQIISSNVQLLKMTVKGNEQIEPHLDGIADATERGTKLAAQLLTFARRQPLHPTVIRTETLLGRIDGLIQRLVGDHIEVKMIVQEDIGKIHVDVSLLENVILNLAANARDAMNGSGTLSIELRNKDIDVDRARHYPGIAPGEYVSLAMSDTGCGMSRGVISRAFEPFFTTKPEGKGTGLGHALN